MTKSIETLSVSLFSEILALEQLLRSRISKGLPKGMELSHFSVLNHLAKTFNLTRGAMTNTLNKLEWAGYVHIRPDWDDARRKQVVISPSGRAARDHAFAQIAPILTAATGVSGEDNIKSILPILRELRLSLSSDV
jgi:DNA-binding MarR family transcriptional regulator